MLGEVAHNFLSSDPVVYAGTLGAIFLTWGSIYAFVIHPRAQEHCKHEEERAALRQALSDKDNLRHQFIDGVSEVPGMTAEIKPAAVRLRDVEHEIARLKEES